MIRKKDVPEDSFEQKKRVFEHDNSLFFANPFEHENVNVSTSTFEHEQRL